ncbi:MAG: hypothetical protein JSS21_05540 [Proteobacteria bacterium]|nr:hypothetical protein [Pseudomonadota bacterium]
MLFDVDGKVWITLLIVLGCPVLVVALLNVLLRNRGGISPGWGGVLVVLLAGVMAVLLILDKIRL